MPAIGLRNWIRNCFDLFFAILGAEGSTEGTCPKVHKVAASTKGSDMLLGHHVELRGTSYIVDSCCRRRPATEQVERHASWIIVVRVSIGIYPTDNVIADPRCINSTPEVGNINVADAALLKFIATKLIVGVPCPVTEQFPLSSNHTAVDRRRPITHGEFAHPRVGENPTHVEAGNPFVLHLLPYRFGQERIVDGHLDRAESGDKHRARARWIPGHGAVITG